jgi:hypothetical protein
MSSSSTDANVAMTIVNSIATATMTGPPTSPYGVSTAAANGAGSATTVMPLWLWGFSENYSPENKRCNRERAIAYW